MRRCWEKKELGKVGGSLCARKPYRLELLFASAVLAKGIDQSQRHCYESKSLALQIKTCLLSSRSLRNFKGQENDGKSQRFTRRPSGGGATLLQSVLATAIPRP